MVEQTFLVELGTEELPPKALRTLAESFATNFRAELEKAPLPHGEVEWFASPRRMALKVTNLAPSQPDTQIEKRGPAISAAFDADGNPTRAAEGWARSNGITVAQAERLTTDKGEWLLHIAKVKGRSVRELLAEMVQNALAKLPIPKPMRWGDESFQFIRPVKTLTMLYGEDLIPGSIMGVSSSRTIRGHRFMGEPEFELEHANLYPEVLERTGKVIADYQRRKSMIKADVEQAALRIGGIADIEEALLEEVTSLVEWPVVLTASFEPAFLKVPAEALVYTMKGDQKYFPVYDHEGHLLPKFIFVSNIESKDPSQVIAGNEKVVRPRLADAEFFFNTDRKRPLVERLSELENVLFQKQLGTLRDKTDRITAMAGFIAERIDANVQHAERAGLLSKCDLMTSMVFEFTDTQGVMGMHYARHDGESEAVTIALNEQYMPRFAGDDLPSLDVAAAVAIADKMDTLVGIFGIGQAPKGDKDPFALRRAALGTLRIIVEKGYQLDLQELVAKAHNLYGDRLTNPSVDDEVIDFMLGRFRSWYQDDGYEINEIQAVLARRPTQPSDFDKRVKAVNHFRTLEACESLAAANKRVRNILSKFEGELGATVNSALLVDPAEKHLAQQIVSMNHTLQPLFVEQRYKEALEELAQLRPSVDDFFEQVMVMSDDESLKINRLTLLNQLRELFLQIADISVLQ